MTPKKMYKLKTLNITHKPTHTKTLFINGLIILNHLIKILIFGGLSKCILKNFYVLFKVT